MSPKGKRGGHEHRFGGDWTTAKLAAVGKYLAAYTTALKEQPFRKAYIDAFAGTGYREARRSESEDVSSQLLPFPDLAVQEPQDLLDGSARLALKTVPRFDRYVFIERSQARCGRLEELKQEFPTLAKDIRILPGDANSEIQNLCKKGWAGRRAVLFLDPYGMQVEWSTIEAVAATRSIDMWLLFPLGIGVNRLLTRSGHIPEEWKRRLNLLLGTESWYEEFYRFEPESSLFGGAEERVIKASTDTIGRYFNDRLRSVFAAVADQPKVLRNSANSPLYLLCFAAGNERGSKIAVRIANDVLRSGV
jgi:three-Cys-motif partner protein